MSSAEWIALLPLILTAGSSVLVMLMIAVHRSHLLTLVLTLIGLVVSFASLWAAAGEAPRQVTSLLLVDRYAIFYMGMILGASFTVASLSYSYFEKCEGQHEELYILLLLATLGSEFLSRARTLFPSSSDSKS